MSHRPALSAAAYLAGELDPRENERFEEHLLSCDGCWTEVDAGRRGLAAVESLRELAPPHLRTAVRRRVEGASPPGRHADKRWLAAAAAVVVAVTGVAVGVVATRGPQRPAVISDAAAAHAAHRLPGSDMPKSPAPDLSALGMTEMGAGAGQIDDIAVTAYAYADRVGRRLTVYVGASSFPMPGSAQMFDGPEGPWMAHVGEVAVLAGRDPHRLLIVGEDDDLVHDAAVALDVM